MKSSLRLLAAGTVVFATAITTNSTAQPDSWTQQADLTSYPRANSVAFCLNGKGYLATGSYFFAGQPHSANDVWRYDPVLDTWWAMNAFGGGDLSAGVAFTVGGTAYVGCGNHAGSPTNTFWAYDPAADTWAERAALPAMGRTFAVAFSIGNKGYVGLGEDANGNVMNDFWEYDPGTDAWTARADFAGGARAYASGFSIGDQGYVVFGGTLDTYTNELWAYDPVSDAWSTRAAYPGTGRHFGIAFGLNGHGFAGTGLNANSIFEDFQEYDPVGDMWTSRADFGAGVRSAAAVFTTDDAAYLATGRSQFFTLNQDLWRYDPLLNTGVDGPTDAALGLYPVPVQDALHWQASTAEEVDVFNSQGERVLSRRLPQGPVTLDLGPLPNGMYVLRAHDAHGWHSERFAKG